MTKFTITFIVTFLVLAINSVSALAWQTEKNTSQNYTQKQNKNNVKKAGFFSSINQMRRDLRKVR